MKKILLLMAIILPFVITSCGDDKDEPQNLEQEIIGTWSAPDGDRTLFFTFNADHTGKYAYTRESRPTVECPLEWELTGKSLTVKYQWDYDIINTETVDISIKNGILNFGDLELHRVDG